MPQRSAVEGLPPDVKAQLDQRLVGSAFSGYDSLSAWLSSLGFEISKSSLHRYGQEFQGKLASLKLATEQVRAIVQAVPDDEGAFNEAVMRLAQERLFSYLVEADIEVRDDKKIALLAKAVHAIADLGRASVRQKEWGVAMRDKLDQKLAALERAAESKDGKLDKETLRRVREEIYGIV